MSGTCWLKCVEGPSEGGPDAEGTVRPGAPQEELGLGCSVPGYPQAQLDRSADASGEVRTPETGPCSEAAAAWSASSHAPEELSALALDALTASACLSGPSCRSAPVLASPDRKTL